MRDQQPHLCSHEWLYVPVKNEYPAGVLIWCGLEWGCSTLDSRIPSTGRAHEQNQEQDDDEEDPCGRRRDDGPYQVVRGVLGDGVGVHEGGGEALRARGVRGAKDVVDQLGVIDALGRKAESLVDRILQHEQRSLPALLARGQRRVLEEEHGDAVDVRGAHGRQLNLGEYG